MSHDFYIWMSYGATAFAMAIELALIRAGRARAKRLVDEERELETQD